MNTEIVRIEENSISSDAAEAVLERAASIIRNGGLVVFPTETVYGLGGDATSAEAAKRIYEAKGRPSDNPLIVHVSTPEEAERYAYTVPLYYKLAEYFMPGPLTVIMRARETVPYETRGGLDTVAIRCPSSPVARAFIRSVGVPIAAPSANLSGSPSPTVAAHVIDDMMGRVDMIIDGGECEIGLESTIVKIEPDGTLLLLRPGKITEHELSQVTSVRIADAVSDKLADGEVAESPGMKYRHYAPKAPLELLDATLDTAVKYMAEIEGNIGIICYTEDSEALRAALPDATFYELGARDDEDEQAHHLFSVLRDADKNGHDIIFAPLPHKEGMGLALYNRMIRAAAHQIKEL